jgi:hypothetical protein
MLRYFDSFSLSGVQRVRIYSLLLMVFFSSPAFSDTHAPHDDAARASVLTGEGKTLPNHVSRMRLIHKYLAGNKGFSSAGKKEDFGFQLRTHISTLVAEYGVTDALTVQLVLPFVTSRQLAMDGQLFQQSSKYSELYRNFLNKASVNLVSKGLCATVESCLIAISEKGLALPYQMEVVLPTGEKLLVNAGVPLRDVASSLVTRSAIPAFGRTGLGDVEGGVLLALADPVEGLWRKDLPVHISVGAGLRIPSGSFSAVPLAQGPTGRGTWDVGLRTNLDWFPFSGLVLSHQNQWELMIVSGKKKRTSLLESGMLNVADVNTIGADGEPNTATFKRDGLRSVGLLKVAWALESISPLLERLSLNAQYKYDLDPATRVEQSEFSKSSSLSSVQCGVSLSGFDFFIPLQWDVDYEVPVSGRNRIVVPVVWSYSLKLFHRF